MANIVHCRVCKQEINKKTQLEEIDWVMPSKNWYYHKECFNSWAKKKNDVHASADDEEWFNLLYDYLKKDIKITIDYPKFKKQWESFLKKGFRAKGIFFCIKYFYEVKNGDRTKAEGGIGIIPHIYEDGRQYWIEREKRDKGICARIEEQIRQAHSREVVIVQKKEIKQKKEINLSMIAEMEED